MKTIQAQQHLKPTPFLNPAHYMAQAIQECIKPNPKQSKGEVKLLVTKNPQSFLNTANALILETLKPTLPELIKTDQAIKALH